MSINAIYPARGEKPAYSAFPATTISGSAALNAEISRKFDSAFERRDFNDFINYTNNLFPAVITAFSPNKKAFLSTENRNVFKIISEPNSPQIIIDKKAHIQIISKETGNIFATPEELSVRSGLNSINSSIIGNGIRTLDPYPQRGWKTSWPPSPYQEMNIFSDRFGNAILLESCGKTGSDYAIKTKGAVFTDNLNSSITWCFQHENLNSTVAQSPWTVAPFKIPAGKRVLSIFPVNEEFKRNYNKANGDFRDIRVNPQWKIDEKNNLAIIDPAQKGRQAGIFANSPSWCLIAAEGASSAILMRTVYSEPFKDKFKCFINSSRAGYFENEFTAPPVKSGEKSTLICRIDFIPLKNFKSADGKPIENFTSENLDYTAKSIAVGINILE